VESQRAMARKELGNQVVVCPAKGEAAIWVSEARAEGARILKLDARNLSTVGSFDRVFPVQRRVPGDPHGRQLNESTQAAIDGDTVALVTCSHPGRRIEEVTLLDMAAGKQTVLRILNEEEVGAAVHPLPGKQILVLLPRGGGEVHYFKNSEDGWQKRPFKGFGPFNLGGHGYYGCTGVNPATRRVHTVSSRGFLLSGILTDQDFSHSVDLRPITRLAETGLPRELSVDPRGIVAAIHCRAMPAAPGGPSGEFPTGTLICVDLTARTVLNQRRIQELETILIRNAEQALYAKNSIIYETDIRSPGFDRKILQIPGRRIIRMLFLDLEK
jgi:hypothetical protein